MYKLHIIHNIIYTTAIVENNIHDMYIRAISTLNKVIIINIEFALQAIGVELIMQGIINLNLCNYAMYVYGAR